MHRIFLPVYRFFATRKSLLYTLLALSVGLFAWFGSRLRYEEDLTKLLPSSGTDSELAFGNLRVKDKIFLQLTAPDATPEELAERMDAFVEALLDRDSSSRYIAHVLYRLDEDMAMNALDYALSHVPSYVDSSCYAAFARAEEPAALAARMRRNAALVAEDETGGATQMVATDPLGLRFALLESVRSGASAGGYTVVDRHFFCADSTVALAFLAPNFKSMDSGSGTALVEMMEAQIAECAAEHPEVDIYFHGSPVNSVFNARRIKKDLVLTVGLSLLVILLLVSICFRSLSLLWQQVIPVAYGALFALACMALIKGTMSLMALGIGAIVLGVALSYCLHVVIHYRYVEDPEKMLRDESTPVCLGCITTVGAFLGLLFTQSDLLRDFGLFSSFALVGNTLFALIFLPHFLRPARRSRNERAFRVIDAVNNYPYDRNPWVLAAVTAVVAVGIIFSPRVSFDSDLRHLGYYDSRVMEGQRLYEEKNLGGFAQLYFATISPDLDEALSASRAVSARLDSLQAEGRVASFTAMAPRLFPPRALQQERIDAWRAWWSPERLNDLRVRLDRAARAEGMSGDMFAPFFALAETEYAPESLYDADLLPESVVSNFIEKSDDGKYLVFTAVRFLPENRDLVSRSVTQLPHAIVIDPFFYTSDMVEVVHKDFSVALGISSLFVLLVLLLSFRNLWIALIAFLPMFLSWYVVQGLMALLGLQFNLINIVVSTFIFGIGVDYSIFIMEGLLAGARRGDTRMLAWHKVAIFFSAAVLMIVIFALMFAVHPAISSIGLSTLIGMVSTIVITYTLQPFLFRLCLKVPWLRRSFGARDDA